MIALIEWQDAFLHFLVGISAKYLLAFSTSFDWVRGSACGVVDYGESELSQRPFLQG